MGEEVGGVRNRWVRKAEIKICDVCCPGGGGVGSKWCACDSSPKDGVGGYVGEI